jgi:hypothetical protein
MSSTMPDAQIDNLGLASHWIAGTTIAERTLFTTIATELLGATR